VRELVRLGAGAQGERDTLWKFVCLPNEMNAAIQHSGRKVTKQEHFCRNRAGKMRSVRALARTNCPAHSTNSRATGRGMSFALALGNRGLKIVPAGRGARK